MVITAERARAAQSAIEKVFDFMSGYMRDVEDGRVRCDFTFGNPHEMPLPGLVGALRRHIEPQSPDWFAYKSNEAAPREVIARALSDELGLPFAPEDIAMTQGAFGAIGLAFSLLMDEGDECLIPLPGWFCYAPMLAGSNLRAVQVPLADDTFDLDLAAIEAAITPRTRVVVVNTPHNPTGRIYSRDSLRDLADLLERQSARIGRRIWILSDEPYRRIRFDGIGFTSPASVYPHTLIDYSYGKILLAPGLRLGYMAIGPLIPEAERKELQDLVMPVQIALGWNFPDAPLQYSVADLETVSIDIAALARRRDRVHGALTQWGYRMTKPEGTFYLWGRAPGGDSAAFATSLRGQGVAVMPGAVFDRDGDFRICLTATDAMIEEALPAFEAAAGA